MALCLHLNGIKKRLLDELRALVRSFCDQLDSDPGNFKQTIHSVQAALISQMIQCMTMYSECTGKVDSQIVSIDAFDSQLVRSLCQVIDGNPHSSSSGFEELFKLVDCQIASDESITRSRPATGIDHLLSWTRKGVPMYGNHAAFDHEILFRRWSHLHNEYNVPMHGSMYAIGQDYTECNRRGETPIKAVAVEFYRVLRVVYNWSLSFNSTELCDFHSDVNVKVNAELLSRIRAVLRSRDMLCQVLRQTSAMYTSASVPWSSLLVSFKWMRKHLEKCVEFMDDIMEGGEKERKIMGTSRNALRDLDHCERWLREHWGSSRLLGKNRLWSDTNGAGGVVPITISDWKVLLKLRALNDHFDGRKTLSLQKEWLGLLATFYWSRTRETRGDFIAGSALSATMASPLQSSYVDMESIVPAFEERLKSHILMLNKKKNDCLQISSLQSHSGRSIIDTADEDDDLPVNDTDEAISFDAAALLRIEAELESAGDDGLQWMALPMMQRALMYLYVQVGVMMKDSKSIDDIVQGTNLAVLCKHCIDLSSTHILPTRGLQPLHLRELQTLQWAAAASKDSMIKGKEDQVGIHNGYQRALQSFFAAGFRRVGVHLLPAQRQTNDCFEGTLTWSSKSLLSFIGTANEYYKLTSGVSKMHIGDASTALAPLRCLQPTQLVGLLRHVDPRLICKDSKIGRHRVLLSGSAELTISTARHAGRKLMDMFSLLCASSASDEIPAISATLDCILSLLMEVVWSCRDFLSPGLIETLQSIKETFAESSLLKVVKQLQVIDLSTNVNESGVQELLHKCMDPLLDLLSQLYAELSSDNDLRIGDDMHVDTKIGRAWVLIGLLRFHLLLPVAPVDPCTKDAAKARLISDYSLVESHRLIGKHWCNILSGSAVNEGLLDGLQEWSDMHHRIQILKNRSIERVGEDSTVGDEFDLKAEQSFENLFLELCDSARNMVNVERLNSLLVDGANASTTIDLMSVMTLVHSWVESMRSFTARLEQDYWQFEDVHAGLVAALECMQHGLSLAVGRRLVHVQALESGVENEQIMHQTWCHLLHPCLWSTAATTVTSTYPEGSVREVIVKELTGTRSLTAAARNRHLDASRSTRSAWDSAEDDVDMDKAGASTDTRVALAADIETTTPMLALMLALTRSENALAWQVMSITDAISLQDRLTALIIDNRIKLDQVRKKKAEEDAAFYRKRNEKTERDFISDVEAEEAAALRNDFPDHLGAFTEFIDAEASASLGIGSAEELASSTNKVNVSPNNENDATNLLKGFEEGTSTSMMSALTRMALLYVPSELVASGAMFATRAGDPLKICRRRLQARTGTASMHVALIQARAISPSLECMVSPTLDRDVRGAMLSTLALLAARCLPRIDSWTLRKQDCDGQLWLQDAQQVWQLNHDLQQTSHEDRFSSTGGVGRKLKLESTRKQQNESSKMNDKRSINTSKSKFSRAYSHIQVQVDRDLLFLLDHEHEISTPWNPMDFHQDPAPDEAAYGNKALTALLKSASRLLLQYPDNEVLLHLCKLTAVVLGMSVSTPLGKLLQSVQLILTKAQEWEQYAAKHVSLQDDITNLSALIQRWRTCELRSWEGLLRSREINYVRNAVSKWHNIARVLTTAADDATCQSIRTGGLAMLTASSGSACIPLHHTSTESASETKVSMHKTFAPLWLLNERRLINSSTISNPSSLWSSSAGMYLQQIFEVLDAFLRGTNVGEFAARLHTIRIFSSQLLSKATLIRNKKNPSLSDTNNRLNTIEDGACIFEQEQLQEMVGLLAYSIWQYYRQFLPAARHHLQRLLTPLNNRVRDEVKIGAWDRLNVYAVLEHSEKAHRKLSRLLTEYKQDALDYPVSGVFRKVMMGGLVDEHGDAQQASEIPTHRKMFPDVGISTTVGNYNYLASSCGSNESSDIDINGVADDPVGNNTDDKKQEEEQEGIGMELDEEVLLDAVEYPPTLMVGSMSSSQRIQIPTSWNWPENSRLRDIPKLTIKANNYLVESLSLSILETNKSYIYKDGGDKTKIGGKNLNRAGVAVAQSVHSLCCAMFERIDNLRREGTTRNMKYKAVGDLFSTLKDEGIRPSNYWL